MKRNSYRGKCERTGRWVYGSLIYVETEVKPYCCILPANCEDDYNTYLDPDLGTIDCEAVPVIPETVSRYLYWACYDKALLCELFEGDIITLRDKRGNPRGVAITVDESSISENGLGRCFPQDTVQADVIGNVWDNPELVGEKYVELYKYYFGFKTGEEK